MHSLSITQCFLSLASNFHAEQNLALARAILDQSLPDYTDINIQAATYSPVVFSQDKNSHTSTSPPLVRLYHNQMVWLVFSSPVTWERLHELTKSLERTALRQEFSKPIVSLDIDILAINLNKKIPVDITTDNIRLIPLLSYSHLLSHFQGKTQKSFCVWYGIARRFPLACYDRYGINYLLNHQLADNRSILPIL